MSGSSSESSRTSKKGASSPKSPRVIAPTRGGIHSVYGLYIGGSPLNDKYQPTIDKRLTYHFASQRRNPKTISSIEQALITSRDSTTTLKFDGRLEPTVGSASEIGKERFMTLLQRRVEEHGHETFYYMKNNTGSVVNILEHSHNFTLDMALVEIETRMEFENTDSSAFDSYEIDDITLSRLVVESLLTSAFYEKIFIRFGHRTDFKTLPGSCLLLMALETCNASVSHDIDGATSSFGELSLDSYPGENVSDFATESLRLIKIMAGGYALPVNTGSRLLIKVSKTSCEEFNRKIFTLLDDVKTMEYRYKVLDPLQLTKDADYVRFGPIALVSTLQQAYGRLISTHDWPALTTKLPESNNSSADDINKDSTKTPRAGTIKCFRCKGDHHIRDCPKTVKKDKDSSAALPDSNKSKKPERPPLAAWKYIEPKDLTVPVVDNEGQEWKFCTHCKCRRTDKVGIYQLSHFDADHVNNYQPPPRTSEGNLAAVTDPHPIPDGPPAATTTESHLDSSAVSDIEFIGVWHTPVEPSPTSYASAVTRGTPKPCCRTLVERELLPSARSSASEILPSTGTAVLPSCFPDRVLSSTPLRFPSKPDPEGAHAETLVDCCLTTSTVPVFPAIAMSVSSSPSDSDAFMSMTFDHSTGRHPVIFDTGASLAITPFKSDFTSALTIPPGDLRLGGMANGLKIEGTGSVTWLFKNGVGPDVSVTSMAYYVPGAKARLLSPQRLLDLDPEGKYEGDSFSFRLQLTNQPLLTIEYDDRNSLPIGYALIGAEIDASLQQSNIAILDDANQNMTEGQKLLLHWHYRFGHLNLPSVQRILRHLPFLAKKFGPASKCALHSLKCTICAYAKAHRRPVATDSTRVPFSVHDATIGTLKANHLKPGAQVSVDHFESRLHGRTFDSYGKASSDTYVGGCIFVDHCTGYLYVEPQLGFSAVETIRAKQAFELLSLTHGVVISSYLTDSGAFKATGFVQHIREHSQKIHFCGRNAHHKNGIAERAVLSVSNMARAMILHATTHWKDGINATLWPMAVQYAAFQYNNLPNAQGLCPADLFTGSTVPRHRLLDIHVWGCPVYVLDPKLQAGRTLPRWEPRSRRGCFMGFSRIHSSEVPLILNLQTGSITAQFHVVFDDHFSTVTSLEREIDPPDHWADLCLENTTYIPIEPTVDGTTHFLDDDWLTLDEREMKSRSINRSDAIRDAISPGDPISSSLDGSILSTNDQDVLPSVPLLPSVSLPLTVATPSVSPPSVTVVGPSPSVVVPASGFRASESTLPVSRVDIMSPTPRASLPISVPTTDVSSNLRRSTRINRGQRITPRYIDEAYSVLAIGANASSSVCKHNIQLAYLGELQTCPDSGLVNISDSRVYVASRRGHDPDNPTFQQAMHGPDASEYIAAMKLEIHTLVQQRTWVSVPRPTKKNVLKGTWAFKLKRLPDGTAYRYKARFCARGDLQKEGIDFFETYAPVVQWSTIRLLLSTVLTEKWTTRQVDYTNAFAQAELNEEVYVEFPRLFGPPSGEDRVLELKKSLYGLRQAPRTFFEKLKAGLEERGWTQSVVDPCLFLKQGMMCVIYVDDTIFASANVSEIDSEIHALGIASNEQRHTFSLRNEGQVNAFLGIQIQQISPNEFELTQTGLIDKVLAATHLTNCNGCETPTMADPLNADLSGAPFTEQWRYDSVIGMLMYLSGNSRPDIAYAVHQAARFTHQPRASHAAGVKRILRYLQKTKTKGLILKPQLDHRVDCYVDADFGGLFSVEDKQHPISVKSRTGYVIMYRHAPLLWVSKMQTQVALSTMEAEYIALSQSMRDLIPIREILHEILSVVFGLKPSITYHSHSRIFEDVTVGTSRHVLPQSTVYEDNDACLNFARMPKLTPRTKHIGVPYHWFRSQVDNLSIHIERVDTANQLADQFTKGLSVEQFRLARKRLMGW
jgi:hypothetical protein